MKRLLLRHTKSVFSRSALLGAVLLVCGYTGIANPRNAVAQTASSAITVPLAAEVPDPHGDDRDPQYLKKREEYLSRFLGIAAGNLSPEAYVKAQAAARALPPSPLLQGRSFMPPQMDLPSFLWTWPIVPPIGNSYGGNASAIIYTLGLDPTDHNVVYTGSFGGLAMTTDGGVTWAYLSDGWSSQAVSSIVVNPHTPSVVYVGTGSDYPPYCVGLYRSSEVGEWTNLGLTEFGGTSIRKVAIDENTLWNKHTTLYVANGRSTTSGLWRSINSGSTWTRLRQGPSSSVWNGIYDVVVDHSTDPSTLYITEDDGTFKSVDSGVTWTPIHSVLAGGPNQLRKVNSTLYLVGPGDPAHNLYKSSDAGATWTQIPTLCFAGADTCAGSYLGLWVFAVDPANPNIILGGNQALYRTTDEGVTWTEIGHWWGPDIHTDQRALAFSTEDPSVVYDGNDGGIVKSTDAGQTWTNLNQNLPGALLYGVALSQDHSMIAGTQDNGAIFSDLGGPWHMIYGGDSAHDLINPTNSSQSYFVIYSPNTFIRYNRLTGQQVNISPAQLVNDPACNFFPTFTMNLSSPTQLVAACQHVVRTLDATVSPVVWTTIGGSLAQPSPAPNEWWNSVTAAYQAPSDSNVIYAIGQFGRVWVTSNANSGAAAVWNDRTGTVPGGVHAVTVHPSDPQTAYLACDSGVYKTTNLGTTWTPHAPANISYSEVAIDPAHPQHVFAASTAGVFASTDGGVTWENMSAGIPAGISVTGISFNAASCRLAASTFGRGVYLADLDCVAPTVSITAPANGAYVFGTVTISATASDDASVAGVQFKLDGVNLGSEDTVAPFSITWTTYPVSPGSHTLTAAARDTSDNLATSAPVAVIVDNESPGVAITAPASGASVAGTVTVSAVASDDVGVVGVQFKLDGAPLGLEDTTAPYSVTWNTSLATGNHTLTAVARDAAGHTQTSAAVVVTVDNVLPTVSITAPPNGAFVRGTVTISATASDNVGVLGVQFKLDGAPLGLEDTTAPYSVNWNTSLATGNHTLTAVARDAAGNTKTSLAVIVTVDNIAPTVAITAPANGATVSGIITVSATAADNVGVIGVQFKLDGVNLGSEDTVAPYSISWNTVPSPGSHTLTAVARDAAGNTATSAGVTVTVMVLEDS